MGGTSTVHAFEQALQTNLQSNALHPNLFGVTVTVGPPTPGELNVGEWIMLGNSTSRQDWKTFPYFAPTSKDETATLDVLVNVVQAIGSDHAILNARAFLLLAEIENELRSNPSQNVPYVLWADVAKSQRVEKRMNPESGWRETLITATVNIRSRI
jgi:hypothetical protein